MRLAKLVRAIRLVAQFRTLWVLVRGLASTAGTIGYTVLLMLIIFYVFACMALELFTKDPACYMVAVHESPDAEFCGLVAQSAPLRPPSACQIMFVLASLVFRCLC